LKTVTKTIEVRFLAYEEREPEVKPDGSKVFYAPMVIYTDFGLRYCKEKMFELAQEGNLAKFEEMLEEYLKFRLAKLAGVESQPIIVKKR